MFQGSTALPEYQKIIINSEEDWEIGKKLCEILKLQIAHKKQLNILFFHERIKKIQ